MKRLPSDTDDHQLRIAELEKENAHFRAEYREHLRILEASEIINQIIIESTEIDTMLKLVLEAFLTIFSCDRAWLLYPCDPNAATYRVPMECTRPQWPGAETEGIDIPPDAFSSKVFELAISTQDPVRFDLETNSSFVDEEISIQFHIRSQMLMAIRPKIGKPWLLGIHHCAAPIIYSQNNCDLFKTLGGRISDGLSSLISWQGSKSLFENAEISIWNTDMSEVRETLDKLHHDGITDLRRHLEGNEHLALEMAALVKVISVNQATLTLFAANTEDEFVYAMDKTLGLMTIDVFIEELCAIWGKKKVFRKEAVFQTLAGNDINAIISFRIPETKDGFNSIPVSIIDITEQKKLEERVRHSQKMEAVGTLAGGIAHDFNNILGIIMGNAELSAMGIGNQSDITQNILEASKRGRDLVLQLLTFSRKNQTAKQFLNPASLIKDALKLLRSTMPSSIEIKEIIEDSNVQIYEDPSQIHQVIMNLCTNANQTMGEKGGILTVGMKYVLINTDTARLLSIKPGFHIEILVQDTGLGMSKEVQEHIFEPFYTTKSQENGVGLGLSVVHGVVQDCDGGILVESEHDNGSTFKVYLPVADTPFEAQSINIKNTSLVKGGGKILFVDDESGLKDVGVQMLTALGYVPVGFTDPKKALDTFLIAPDSFDAVITDQVMPGITGNELAARILEVRPYTPIFLCTGYSEKITEDNATAAGFRGFFLKPISMPELSKALKYAIDYHQTGDHSKIKPPRTPSHH